MPKETTRRARLEPRTSRSGVRGVNRSATHNSAVRVEQTKVQYRSNYFGNYEESFFLKIEVLQHNQFQQSALLKVSRYLGILQANTNGSGKKFQVKRVFGDNANLK